MCGINGFATSNHKNEDSVVLLNKMNTVLQHRGPDSQGVFFVPHKEWSIGLAQVRLSIIDLSPAGAQPMSYDQKKGGNSEMYKSQTPYDNHLTITFNGEIYNYLEIRSELEQKGYIFSTRSDTEVIMASYLEWGTKCVTKFNGMWAFCLFDKDKEILFCSRDRMGKKPFYYHWTGESFIFSSEIKGILVHDVNKDIDLEAIDFYLTGGYIPAPWSIYKSIRKLEARHSIIIDLTNKTLSKECYYEIPEFKPENNKKRLIQKGKELLEDATKIRMFTSDVPVGAFLSGGLDSSAVVGEMTKWVEKEKLHTFSIGFEGKYDETSYINIVKDAFGTNHHHEYFREPDFEKMIEGISEFYDEPFGDFSNFPTTSVSKLAKKHVTVSLSGDGGDEIFGGYLMHQIGAQMDFIRLVPKFLRQFLYLITPKTKNNLSIFSKLKEAFRVSLLPKEKFYSEASGTSIYKPEVYKKWTEEKLSEILKRCNGNFTQSLIDFDLFYNTLSDNFLVKTDRASMSQALEIRAPLLDYRFIEYSRTIPVKWKVNIFKTKIIMREIIKDIVPETILKRGKQGFTPPIEKWILQEKYLQTIKNGIEKLYNTGILNAKWYSFYTNTVLENNNTMFNVFKIKMFLLIKWEEKWLK